ncbi:MAG: histidine phosphatase family protein [Candidatus Omnitrophica bacterium]|nr:histidine phosphatase family protein [Candidatus Omnitrophota bacterium]
MVEVPQNPEKRKGNLVKVEARRAGSEEVIGAAFVFIKPENKISVVVWLEWHIDQEARERVSQAMLGRSLDEVFAPDAPRTEVGAAISVPAAIGLGYTLFYVQNLDGETEPTDYIPPRGARFAIPNATDLKVSIPEIGMKTGDQAILLRLLMKKFSQHYPDIYSYAENDKPKDGSLIGFDIVEIFINDRLFMSFLAQENVVEPPAQLNIDEVKQWHEAALAEGYLGKTPGGNYKLTPSGLERFTYLSNEYAVWHALMESGARAAEFDPLNGDKITYEGVPVLLNQPPHDLVRQLNGLGSKLRFEVPVSEGRGDRGTVTVRSGKVTEQLSVFPADAFARHLNLLLAGERTPGARAANWKKFSGQLGFKEVQDSRVTYGEDFKPFELGGMELWFQLHGLTPMNEQNRVQGMSADAEAQRRGQPELTSLNTQGRGQARESALALWGQFKDRLLKGDKSIVFVTSGLKRADETAGEFVRLAQLQGEIKITPVVIPALSEIDLGEWELRTRAELAATGVTESQRQQARDFFAGPKQGESFSAFLLRIHDALKTLKRDYPGKTVVVLGAHQLVESAVEILTGTSRVRRSAAELGYLDWAKTAPKHTERGRLIHLNMLLSGTRAARTVVAGDLSLVASELTSAKRLATDFAGEARTIATRLAAEVHAEAKPVTYPLLVRQAPVFFVVGATPRGVSVSAIPVVLPFDGNNLSQPIFSETFSRNARNAIRAGFSRGAFTTSAPSFNAYEMATGQTAKVWNEIFRGLSEKGGSPEASVTGFTLPAEVLSSETDLAQTIQVLDAIAKARGMHFEFILTYPAGTPAPDPTTLEKLSSQSVMLKAVEVKAGQKVLNAVLDGVELDRLGQLVMAADVNDIQTHPDDLGINEAAEKLHERVRLVGIEKPLGVPFRVSVSKMVQAGLSALLGIPVSSALGLKKIDTVFGPIYVITALVDKELAEVRHAKESDRSA